MNRCLHTQTTSRNMSIEVHDLHEELKGYRIDNVPFITCAVCGSSWYALDAEKGTQTPLEKQPTHAPDAWEV